ncbi:MAG: Txe/YoeB family addiction module toxin [Bacteroidetes bacterium]|nr:Txe/YoeB family addiction module toxin [Bacteroidota bacterium]
MYKLLYTKQAKKDAEKLSESNLKGKTQEILKIIENNPFEDYPPYEKLIGDLTGAFSRRINIQHRIVYQVLEEEKIVKIIRMWTHYE